jgi:hypothetical protein
LWHLEGQNVSALVDGYVSANPNNSAYEIKTVTNGSISFAEPHVVIHAGLPITADLETLNIDRVDGSSLADKRKHVSEVTVFFEESRGLWAGPDGDNLTELKSRSTENYDTPPNLITGVEEIVITPTWSSTGQVMLRQIDPLPLSILAVVPAGFLAK